MARSNRNPMNVTFGSNAYDLDFYGDVVAVPAPTYAPPQTETGSASAPKEEERAKARSRVKVRVREQQAVAPFAICGFVAILAVAIVLLLGYVQLNSIYSETVKLQSQLTTLQNEGANLQARYEETFDRVTLERAIAENGTLTSPNTEQSVYVDLSEPDNAVVYNDNNGSVLATLGNLAKQAVEFFR